jgi:hypothetical protein
MITGTRFSPSTLRLLSLLAPAAGAAALVLALTLPGCGGSSGSGSSPDPLPPPTPTPTPAPTPTPTPAQSAACTLTAPKVDCSQRPTRPQEHADALQEAVDAANRTPGVMYADNPNRVYDLERWRSIVVAQLTAKSMCAAWDYGNVTGDEIFVRSEDGCVAEQYDLLTGEGGVRPVGKSSNAWQEGFGVPVPGPRPNWSKEGDTACSLPGARGTFCFSIRNTSGEFGRDVYNLVAQVHAEFPSLIDKNDTLPGQGTTNPDELRFAAMRIVNLDGYIAQVEAKLRASGFCAFIEKGDILKVKKVSNGNLFHEEIDAVQNPASGGAYVGFVVKDRCHTAGF